LVVVGVGLLATDVDNIGPTAAMARAELQEAVEHWAATQNTAVSLLRPGVRPPAPRRGTLSLCVEFGIPLDAGAVGLVRPFQVMATIREEVVLERDGLTRQAATFEVSVPPGVVVNDDLQPVRDSIVSVLAVVGLRLETDNPPPRPVGPSVP
jgi:hypothetical protein